MCSMQSEVENTRDEVDKNLPASLWSDHGDEKLSSFPHEVTGLGEEA